LKTINRLNSEVQEYIEYDPGADEETIWDHTDKWLRQQ
jgi:hypothetical protein